VPIPKIVAKYKLQKMPFKPALPKQTKMQVFLSSVSGTNAKKVQKQKTIFSQIPNSILLWICVKL